MKHVSCAAVVLTSLIALGAAGCAGHDKPSDVAGAGWAKLNCAVAANGGLEDCRIVGEHPSDAGFGQAALEAARSGRLAPRTVTSAAVGARVEFTIRFRLDQTAPPNAGST